MIGRFRLRAAAPGHLAAASQAGLTLVELAVVVAILTVLAGIAIPAATAIIERKTEDDTAERMTLLEEAIVRYAADTLTVPTTLDDLRTDPGVSGWRGPYIGDFLRGWRGRVADFDLDGWRRAFTWLPNAPNGGTLESSGSDGFAPSSDDLTLEIDVRPELRRIGSERLQIANAAILRYNRDPANPPALTGDATSVVATLVGANFLPAGYTFDRDAFGVLFATVGNPVVAFQEASAGSSPIRRSSGASRGGRRLLPPRSPLGAGGGEEGR